MKSILRNIIFYASALFVLTQILEGVKISGGLLTFIIGGAVLSLIFLVIKPILNLIALPLNIATLGLFSFFSNTVLLYMLTVFVPEVKINAFEFQGYSFAGFIIPKVTLNSFMAFVVAALSLSIIISFLTWLVKK